MTGVRTALTDDRSSQVDGDVLVRRYDEVYAAWKRQKAIGAAMRASRDGGPGDDADHASTSTQVDEQDALTGVLRTRLDDLATALERCDDGSYGRCEECGSVIPADRLELFPAATHCVRCKQRQKDADPTPANFACSSAQRHHRDASDTAAMRKRHDDGPTDRATTDRQIDSTQTLSTKGISCAAKFSTSWPVSVVCSSS